MFQCTTSSACVVSAIQDKTFQILSCTLLAAVVRPIHMTCGFFSLLRCQPASSGRAHSPCCPFSYEVQWCSRCLSLIGKVAGISASLDSVEQDGHAGYVGDSAVIFDASERIRWQSVMRTGGGRGAVGGCGMLELRARDLFLL